MKRYFIILVFYFSFITMAQTAVEYTPQSAIDASVEELAVLLKLPSSTIKDIYQITWEYIIVYDDDQPIVIRFSTSQFHSYCEVTLGSKSLTILDKQCN